MELIGIALVRNGDARKVKEWRGFIEYNEIIKYHVWERRSQEC